MPAWVYIEMIFRHDWKRFQETTQITLHGEKFRRQQKQEAPQERNLHLA